ncbi:hemerythrin domain-containing protein [Kitasatospora sp. NPDC101157]|uniref:hemerythrin domain-containing protein n=1 Tax=Kitasatospora sp. NPDC101157 TaxID=3364098 RepID=UPI00380812E0
MCEYCGCQTLPAIATLTAEHDAVVNLIGDVRAAHSTGDVPRMAATARRIAAVLAPHTEVEEGGLFPALAQEFPDQIAALEAEHRRIEAVLHQAAAGTPTDPSWPEQLLEALAMLRDHILKEQDGVFPAALISLDAEQWEAVDAVRAGVGTALSPTGRPR